MLACGPCWVRYIQDPISAMSSFPVTPERESRLAERMARLKVVEEDLDESFVRSGGHGGQNVNKTSTCVQIVHRPTGTSVKCQTTRQQGMNRFLARQMLLDKIEEARRAVAAAERARIEKARRQKRPRSRGAKERILASKSRQSVKKQLRTRPDRDGG